MKKFTSLLCLLIVVCLALSVTAFADSDVTYVDTVRVGDFNGAGFVTPTFDPFGLTGSITNNGTNYLIYDVLFYITASGVYESRVVESYEWTDDTHLVINIKDGIFFSNGDQLLGDDILYSLGLRQQSSMRAAYYQIFLLDESTVSEDGLQITLVTAAPNSIYMYGLDFAIVDKDYVEGEGFDNIDWSDPDQIIGSGPYEITYYMDGSEVDFAKRDDYWGLEYGYDDAVEEFQVYNYTDRSTMSIDFETGVIDLAIDLAETDYARLVDANDGSYTPALIHSNDIFYFALANNTEFMSDPAVREAVCYAADIDAITAAHNGSYGGVADSMFAPTELGYVSGTAYERDVERAKQVLADAGYGEGDVKLTILVYGIFEAPATVLQSNLAEAGIELDVQYVDIASYWGNIGGEGNSDFQVYQTSNPSCDPAVHMAYWKSDSAFNVMRRDYDDLVVAAETTLDTDERIALYEELQARWYENYDAIPVCEYLVSFAYNNDVFNHLELAAANCPWLLDNDFYVGN